MEMAKVTSKGQVTIPVSIRRRLGINEGDKLLFIDRPDGVMIVNPDTIGPERADDLSASQPPAPPVNARSSAPQTNGFDVAALLNEIRSIGSKI